STRNTGSRGTTPRSERRRRRRCEQRDADKQCGSNDRRHQGLSVRTVRQNSRWKERQRKEASTRSCADYSQATGVAVLGAKYPAGDY
ncbi:hypothetical protein FBU31_006965, partial [Coemansia sp. 'formosensis']